MIHMLDWNYVIKMSEVTHYNQQCRMGFNSDISKLSTYEDWFHGYSQHIQDSRHAAVSLHRPYRPPPVHNVSFMTSTYSNLGDLSASLAAAAQTFGLSPAVVDPLINSRPR